MRVSIIATSSINAMRDHLNLSTQHQTFGAGQYRPVFWRETRPSTFASGDHLKTNRKLNGLDILVEVSVQLSKSKGRRWAAKLLNDCGVPFRVISRVLSDEGPRRVKQRAR